MTNEALVTTIVPGDVPIVVSIIPNVSSYDFATDADRPTVTNGGSGPHVFYRWQTQIVIRLDESPFTVVATSAATYTDKVSNALVQHSATILSAYNKWILAQSISDADKKTGFMDSNIMALMIGMEAGDLSFVKYQAGQVSTSLAIWNTTIRDIIKQMCDDFLGNP